MSTTAATKASILIVEDDDDVRDLLVRRVNNLGHEAQPTASGEEALSYLEQHQPSLILLDIGLPGIDGWEFLRQLRQRKTTATIPVLVVSILDDDPADDQPPIDGYVVKPFRPSAIDNMVANLLTDAESSADEQT